MMTPEELKEKLIPFLSEGYPSYMISIDSGWVALIDQCHEALVTAYPEYRIAQIKEKFGTLRYYVEVKPEYWDLTSNIIRGFESKSAETCSICGQLGKTNAKRGWWLTLCPEHWDV